MLYRRNIHSLAAERCFGCSTPLHASATVASGPHHVDRCADRLLSPALQAPRRPGAAAPPGVVETPSATELSSPSCPQRFWLLTARRASREGRRLPENAGPYTVQVRQECERYRWTQADTFTRLSLSCRSQLGIKTVLRRILSDTANTH